MISDVFLMNNSVFPFLLHSMPLFTVGLLS